MISPPITSSFTLAFDSIIVSLFSITSEQFENSRSNNCLNFKLFLIIYCLKNVKTKNVHKVIVIVDKTRDQKLHATSRIEPELSKEYRYFFKLTVRMLQSVGFEAADVSQQEPLQSPEKLGKLKLYPPE